MRMEQRVMRDHRLWSSHTTTSTHRLVGELEQLSNLLSKRARSAGRGHAEHTAEERLKAELQGPSLLSAWSSSGIAEPLHVLSA